MVRDSTLLDVKFKVKLKNQTSVHAMVTTLLTLMWHGGDVTVQLSLYVHVLSSVF